MLTFEPHPADYFAGRPVVFRLTPLPIKARILRSLGLAGAAALTFDAALAGLTAEEFVEQVLVERLGVGAVVVGWDFHFGKRARGAPDDLVARRARGSVSRSRSSKRSRRRSTAAPRSFRPRRSAARSNAATSRRRRAASGRDYVVAGLVAHGQRLGRTLGVPTANLALEPTNRLAFGVYAVQGGGRRRGYGGVASFGVRPTVNSGAPLLEVHLFDFSGDIYGQRDGGRVPRPPARRAEIRLARRAEGANGARPRRGARGRSPPGHLAIPAKSSNPCAAKPGASLFFRMFDPFAMTDAPAQGPDYSDTLFLPKTDFPMRAGLPQKEPEILARWAREGLYGRCAASAKGRPKFVLHDGPPYANGNIHIGHALNKILKDLVVRSQQMAGKDSNYVPGWDCHGLPIEWKVEEENYRSKGKAKPDFSDAKAMVAFRRECRAYAEHWLSVQREEFKRLGVVGDWDHPYSTMSYPAEAQIAREIFKFAANGLLYRGSKPVMWSVVEKTALAEAEVEYEDHASDTVYVAFPCAMFSGRLAGGASSDASASADLQDASVVIWTTTPWTFPGNRAIAFSERIAYGLYRVTEAPPRQLGQGRRDLHPRQQARAERLRCREGRRLRAGRRRRRARRFAALALRASAAAALGYEFRRPAARRRPRHRGHRHGLRPHRARPRPRGLRTVDGERRGCSTERDIDTRIPYTVDENGAFTDEAPGLRRASASSPTRARRATPTRRSSRR